MWPDAPLAAKRASLGKSQLLPKKYSILGGNILWLAYYFAVAAAPGGAKCNSDLMEKKQVKVAEAARCGAGLMWAAASDPAGGTSASTLDLTITTLAS